MNEWPQGIFVATFGQGLSAGSVVWTALLIGAYALLVNVFYQVLSKRIMFATRVERKTELELSEAMDAAEVAREEAEQAVTAAAEEKDPVVEQAQVAAAAAVETEAAVAKAQAVIEEQAQWGWRSITRNSAYFALVPLVIFGFFLLLTGALVFLTSGQRDVADVMALSMAVILAVRITAYLSEATSHDIAKMLPLALLGFFLVDGGFAGAQAGWAEIVGVGDQLVRALGFLTLIVAVEFSLRLVDFVARRIRRSRWVAKQEELDEPS